MLKTLHCMAIWRKITKNETKQNKKTTKQTKKKNIWSIVEVLQFIKCMMLNKVKCASVHHTLDESVGPDWGVFKNCTWMCLQDFEI